MLGSGNISIVKISARYFLFPCLILVCDCSGKVTPNDKYPDIPYLTELSDERYTVQMIDFQASSQIGNFLVGDTYNYPEDSLTLFDLEQGAVKKIPVKGRRRYVDELLGYIFTSINDSVFFRYRFPEFREEMVEFMRFQSCYDSVADKNTQLEIFQVRMVSDSIDNARLRSKAICKAIFWDREHCVLYGAHKDVIIPLDDGIRLDSLTCIHKLDYKFLPEPQYLKPFDNAVLDRIANTGYHGNLLFGVEEIKLFYYKLEAGSESIAFKDLSSYIQFFKTPDNRTIVLKGFEIFEIKSKASL